jgi:hypothetical protein
LALLEALDQADLGQPNLTSPMGLLTEKNISSASHLT